MSHSAIFPDTPVVLVGLKEDLRTNAEFEAEIKQRKPDFVYVDADHGDKVRTRQPPTLTLTTADWSAQRCGASPLLLPMRTGYACIRRWALTQGRRGPRSV